MKTDLEILISGGHSNSFEPIVALLGWISDDSVSDMRPCSVIDYHDAVIQAAICVSLATVKLQRIACALGG